MRPILPDASGLRRARGLVAPVLLLVLVACPGPEPGPGPDAAPRSPTPAPAALEEIGWRSLAPLPTQRTEVTAATYRERIYVAGGFNEAGETVAAVDVYDPTADGWTGGPDLPLPVNHAMAAADDDVGIVLAGGYRGGLEDASDRAFLLEESVWRELPRMPEPRAAGGAVFADGRLWVVGGVGPGGLASTMQVYDPGEDAWSITEGPPTRREHLGVASHDDRIYVVGGRTGGIGSNLSAAEAFDPAAGSWESLPEMPTPRGGLAAVATANGFVVAPGGEAEEGTFEEAEAYDILEDAWVSLPPLPTARHGLGVVEIGNLVYVIGGGPQPGLTVSAANEAIDLEPLRV